jgi:hypothetical protein
VLSSYRSAVRTASGAFGSFPCHDSPGIGSAAFTLRPLSGSGSFGVGPLRDLKPSLMPFQSSTCDVVPIRADQQMGDRSNRPIDNHKSKSLPSIDSAPVIHPHAPMRGRRQRLRPGSVPLGWQNGANPHHPEVTSAFGFVDNCRHIGRLARWLRGKLRSAACGAVMKMDWEALKPHFGAVLSRG